MFTLPQSRERLASIGFDVAAAEAKYPDVAVTWHIAYRRDSAAAMTPILFATQLLACSEVAEWAVVARDSSKPSSGRFWIVPGIVTADIYVDVVTAAVAELCADLDISAASWVMRLDLKQADPAPLLSGLFNRVQPMLSPSTRRGYLVLEAAANAQLAQARLDQAVARWDTQRFLDNLRSPALGKLTLTDVDRILDSGLQTAAELVALLAASFEGHDFAGMLHYLCGKPNRADLDAAIARWSEEHEWFSTLSSFAPSMGRGCADLAVAAITRPVEALAMIVNAERLGGPQKVFGGELMLWCAPLIEALAALPVPAAPAVTDEAQSQVDAARWLLAEADAGVEHTPKHLAVKSALGTSLWLLLLAQTSGTRRDWLGHVYGMEA